MTYCCSILYYKLQIWWKEANAIHQLTVLQQIDAPSAKHCTLYAHTLTLRSKIEAWCCSHSCHTSHCSRKKQNDSNQNGPFRKTSTGRFCKASSFAMFTLNRQHNNAALQTMMHEYCQVPSASSSFTQWQVIPYFFGSLFGVYFSLLFFNSVDLYVSVGGFSSFSSGLGCW